MTKRVLLLSSPRSARKTVLQLIDKAARLLGAEAYVLNEMAFGPGKAATLRPALEKGDVIVCDLADASPIVLYELGLANSLGRPFILVADHPESIPAMLSGSITLIYTLSPTGEQEFVDALRDYLETALRDPVELSRMALLKEQRGRIFISYAHQDRPYLDRLLVHLRPLEREQVIDLFSDHLIKAGEEWRKRIEVALVTAKAAVLLISADFLASDFIVNNELLPLLEGAEKRGTRIIPVIVKPCRFDRDSNLNKFQAINDPRQSLIEIDEFQRERVYDGVASLLEELVRHRGENVV